MNRQLQDNLHASILDRLIDHEPELSSETAQSRSTGFREIREAVIRDIENLLNTKRSILPVSAAFPEVEKSLFTFGVADYSADSPNSSYFRKKLLKDLRNTLARFEPRLRNVTVRVDPSSDNAQGLGFRISGVLVVDPIAEPVIFDTYFDPKKDRYVIER
ncbi:MAG: hypothetical protein BM485_03760 [Desulfobulbaceae bacterium DB1]|nr:MAG: hypothetical protein BM485_03760 [Desulfobulbaceae bacterium DB1]